MTVFRRKTSRGFSKFYNYRFRIDGQIYYGSCYLESADGEKIKCTTKEEALIAEKKAKDFALNLRKHKTEKGLVEEYREKLSGGQEILLSDAFDFAMQKPRKRKMSEKQLESKRSYWRDFISFLQGRNPDITNLKDVRKRHAEEYIALLQTKGRYNQKVEYSQKNKPCEYKRDHNLSPRTVKVFYTSIKEIFTLLAKDAGLSENPFDGISLEKVESYSREAFTPEELKKIAEKADGFIYHIFMVGANTALREGDICTLKWSEVDLKNNLITRKTRKTGTIVEIPILPDLRQHLLHLNEQRDKQNEYVSPEHAKLYLETANGVSWRVRKFLESIGIETTRKVEGRTRKVSVKDVHSLRHTFCYLAGLQNIPVAIVQSIAGHMDTEMTRHYQMHADVETKKKEIRKLSGFMIPVLGSKKTKLIGSKTSDQRIDEVINFLKEKKKLTESEKQILKMLNG